MFCEMNNIYVSSFLYFFFGDNFSFRKYRLEHLNHIHIWQVGSQRDIEHETEDIGSETPALGSNQYYQHPLNPIQLWILIAYNTLWPSVVTPYGDIDLGQYWHR